MKNLNPKCEEKEKRRVPKFLYLKNENEIKKKNILS
jgi:hypothetical protein